MSFVLHERYGSTLVTPHVQLLIEKNNEEKCEQKSEEWYRRRQQFITASTIASVCGDNPYEKRKTALKKKLAPDNAFSGNEATRHGNEYEPVAIEKYERTRVERVFSFGLLTSLNPGEDFIAGSPDGITASGRLIEVKCPYLRTPNGTVPSHYVHQIQTLLHILRLDVCDYIEYVPETWNSDE